MTKKWHRVCLSESLSIDFFLPYEATVKVPCAFVDTADCASPPRESGCYRTSRSKRKKGKRKKMGYASIRKKKQQNFDLKSKVLPCQYDDGAKNAYFAVGFF